MGEVWTHVSILTDGTMGTSHLASSFHMGPWKRPPCLFNFAAGWHLEDPTIPDFTARCDPSLMPRNILYRHTVQPPTLSSQLVMS